MSELPINHIQEIVERSVYHTIRSLCVEWGYTPDISDFDQTPAGYSAYQAGLKQIYEEKGLTIEVFASGPATEKELKKVPRIAIDTQGFNNGDIGGEFALQYELAEDQSYVKYKGFDLTSDLYINIWLISRTIQESRILNAIIAHSLPRRGYIPVYNNPEIKIFSRNLSFSKPFEPINPALMENIERYVFKDLIEVPRNIIVPEIPKLLEFDLEINT